MSSCVPDDLMQRLHNANNAFAEARAKFKNLEQLDAKQRTEAAETLRSAEKEVEICENAISAFLEKQSQGQAPA